MQEPKGGHWSFGHVRELSEKERAREESRKKLGKKVNINFLSGLLY